MSAAISQLSGLSLINRRLQIQTKPNPFLSLRTEVFVVNHESQRTNIFKSDIKTTLSYTTDASKSHNRKAGKSNSTANEHAIVPEMSEQAQEHIPQKYRAAKIHDFCFGIPFGGLVLSGGLVGFIFSRNASTLSTGVLFGGALLALSTVSLKFWRQGKSSFPFIFGQAVLAAALFWKNFQMYSLTRKLFPSGFYAVISAAMLLFYSYVVVSGGNPPPKKKSSAAVSS